LKLISTSAAEHYGHDIEGEAVRNIMKVMPSAGESVPGAHEINAVSF
jgi:hypothetical protein